MYGDESANKVSEGRFGTVEALGDGVVDKHDSGTELGLGVELEDAGRTLGLGKKSVAPQRASRILKAEEVGENGGKGPETG